MTNWEPDDDDNAATPPPPPPMSFQQLPTPQPIAEPTSTRSDSSTTKHQTPIVLEDLPKKSRFNYLQQRPDLNPQSPLQPKRQVPKDYTSIQPRSGHSDFRIPLRKQPTKSVIDWPPKLLVKAARRDDRWIKETKRLMVEDNKRAENMSAELQAMRKKQQKDDKRFEDQVKASSVAAREYANNYSSRRKNSPPPVELLMSLNEIRTEHGEEAYANEVSRFEQQTRIAKPIAPEREEAVRLLQQQLRNEADVEVERQKELDRIIRAEESGRRRRRSRSPRQGSSNRSSHRSSSRKDAERSHRTRPICTSSTKRTLLNSIPKGLRFKKPLEKTVPEIQLPPEEQTSTLQSEQINTLDEEFLINETTSPPPLIIDQVDIPEHENLTDDLTHSRHNQSGATISRRLPKPPPSTPTPIAPLRTFALAILMERDQWLGIPDPRRDEEAPRRDPIIEVPLPRFARRPTHTFTIDPRLDYYVPKREPIVDLPLLLFTIDAARTYAPPTSPDSDFALSQLWMDTEQVYEPAMIETPSPTPSELLKRRTINLPSWSPDASCRSDTDSHQLCHPCTYERLIQMIHPKSQRSLPTITLSTLGHILVATWLHRNTSNPETVIAALSRQPFISDNVTALLQELTVYVPPTPNLNARDTKSIIELWNNRCQRAEATLHICSGIPIHIDSSSDPFMQQLTNQFEKGLNTARTRQWKPEARLINARIVTFGAKFAQKGIYEVITSWTSPLGQDLVYGANVRLAIVQAPTGSSIDMESLKIQEVPTIIIHNHCQEVTNQPQNSKFVTLEEAAKIVEETLSQ